MENGQLAEWIEKSKNGDKRAFESLVNAFQPMVFRLSFRMLDGDMNETKDMVQEVFIKVWLSLCSYNSAFRFSTWLYKITHNTCLDRLRTFRQRQESRESEWYEAFRRLSSGEDVEAGLINKDLAAVILHLTEELSPKQKSVFILNDIEGLEIPEIEEITSLTPEKIKSNLYLARKFIRNKLTEII